MSVILFVDHELTMHEFLPYAAQRAGHSVYRANSIAAALEHFSRYKPDVIAVNYLLPGNEIPNNGGFELARRANLFGFEDDKIILLTDVMIKEIMLLKEMLRNSGLDGVHLCQIRSGYLPFLRTVHEILCMSDENLSPGSGMESGTQLDILSQHRNQAPPWAKKTNDTLDVVSEPGSKLCPKPF